MADVTDVTDVTDGGDNKICGHSLERAVAVCLSGTSGGPPHLSGGPSVCHTLKLRSWWSEKRACFGQPF